MLISITQIFDFLNLGDSSKLVALGGVKYLVTLYSVAGGKGILLVWLSFIDSLDFAMEKELLSSEALQNPHANYEYKKYM